MSKDKKQNIIYSEGTIGEDLHRKKKAMKERDEFTHNNTIISVPFSHLNNCFSILEGEKFDIHTFFELAAYLELGVLFDSFAIVPDCSKEIFGKVAGSVLKSLIGATENLFIYFEGEDFTVFSGGIQEKIILRISDKSSLFQEVDYFKYFSNVIAVRQQLFVPSYHVPFEVLNHYLDLTKYEDSLRAYSLLILAYEELSYSLKKEIRLYEKFFRSKILFIPPIMTVILDRCSCPAEIPEAFIELRKEFKPLRNYFGYVRVKCGKK